MPSLPIERGALCRIRPLWSLAGSGSAAGLLAVLLLCAGAAAQAQQSGSTSRTQQGQRRGASTPAGAAAAGAVRSDGAAGDNAPANVSTSKASLINESQLVGLPLNGRSY